MSYVAQRLAGGIRTHGQVQSDGGAQDRHGLHVEGANQPSLDAAQLGGREMGGRADVREREPVLSARLSQIAADREEQAAAALAGAIDRTVTASHRRIMARVAYRPPTRASAPGARRRRTSFSSSTATNAAVEATSTTASSCGPRASVTKIGWSAGT